MKEFFLKLFDTADFPARWHCGNWTAFHGWLHILSDLAIFGAYAAIPISIAYYIFVKRQEIIFLRLYWFFAAFILSCGLTHLLDATIFWHPWYRLAALVKFITAVASWTTVILLLRTLPMAMALPGTLRFHSDLKREIEERKRSEAALQAFSTQLKLAMQHSKLGDWRWNPNTDETIFSARTLEIFGMPPDSRENWGQISQRLHPDDRQRTFQAIQTALDKKADYDIEYRVTRPLDQREVWVSAKGRAEYSPEGKVTVMIGTVQDVTDRKQNEAEREELLLRERSLRNEAERVGLMKDEFLATLSHELRTPLNAILGWTQLLKDEDEETQRHQGLAVIERNTRVQTQLVDDLLDMNRVITGKLRLDMQPVDLKTIVNDALESVLPSAQLKNIRLETQFDSAVKDILGDASRLQQIIWNLLANAIKFTPNDGCVSVSTQATADGIEIVITDSGPGIAEDFLPYVFDRFRQADASISRKYGGLGLGLAIVKNLVEMHGGRVEAESSGENQGATFRVRLPVLTTSELT